MLREVVVKWLLFDAVLGAVTFGLAPLLDVLWPLWDEENRALHDFIVGTPGDSRLGDARRLRGGEARRGRPRSR